YPQLLKFQKWIVVGDSPGDRQEQTVAERQHVGLEAKGDAPPALVPGELEGVADNALRGRPGHDAQAFDHAGYDVMFLPGIKPLGILADHDEIDILIRNSDARQGAHGPDTGVQVERL